MIASVEFVDWEGLHFRGVDGTVSAMLPGEKTKINVKLSGSHRLRRGRGTCTLAVVGDMVQPQFSAQSTYSELVIFRVPMLPSHTRATVELSGQLTKSKPDGAIWFVKAPDGLGEFELAAELDGKMLTRSKVIVKPPSSKIETSLTRTFFDLSGARSTTIQSGDVVGIPIPPSDLGGKLRWYVR